MSEMIPYHILFEEQAHHETREITLKGISGIPDDSYGLVEFYCPDPERDCNMVMLALLSQRLMKQVATLVYFFDPKDGPPGMSNPDLDLAPQVSFAKNFLEWFSAHLQKDIAYVDRLNVHYHQIKEVESNPSHSSFSRYQAWMEEMNHEESLQEDEAPRQKRKGGTGNRSLSVPKSMQALFEAITQMTDHFCQQHLNEEYRDLCQKMAATLARKRPSPLSGGNLNIWAAGIVHIIGRVNFVFDKTQEPHLRRDDISDFFNVKGATASQKAGSIRKILNIGLMDPK